jgi:hypothetical protein
MPDIVKVHYADIALVQCQCISSADAAFAARFKVIL